MSDDEGNGTVHPIRPVGDPLRALAETTAHKQTAADREIRTLEQKVDEIHKGETPWQKGVDAKLATLADGMMAVRMAHIAWPPVLLLAACVLGGYGAMLTYLLTRIH